MLSLLLFFMRLIGVFILFFQEFFVNFRFGEDWCVDEVISGRTRVGLFIYWI